MARPSEGEVVLLDYVCNGFGNDLRKHRMCHVFQNQIDLELFEYYNGSKKLNRKVV